MQRREDDEELAQAKPMTLPTNSYIYVSGEGKKTGEVVIECMQPKGYFIANLSLLFDSSPRG